MWRNLYPKYVMCLEIARQRQCAVNSDALSRGPSVAGELEQENDTRWHSDGEGD